MARSFLTGINLNKNELSNAAIQPLTEAPLNPTIGQIYFDTGMDTIRQWDGTQWLSYNNDVNTASQYIDAVDNNFVVNGTTLSLAGTVNVHSTVNIGAEGTEPDDGFLRVKKADGTTVFDVNGVNNTVNFYRNNGDLAAHFEHSFTNTFRVISDDDLSLRSQNGDIILYPGNDDGGTGKAYVHWGNDATGSNPQNEITTAGNSQDLTNKTIATPTVYGKTSFKNATSEDPEYLSIERAYTGTARFVAPDDISIRSTGGDIILYPGNQDGGTGKAYIGWGDDAWGAYPEREIATKGYVDGVAQGLSVIGSVVTASTSTFDLASNWSSAGAPAISGHSLAEGERVLLKNQSTATENGIYIVTALDVDWYGLVLSTNLEDTNLKVGSYTLVTAGYLAATGWIVTAYSGGASTWTQFSAANEYTAGTGIDITENAISVKYGDGLAIDMGGNLTVDREVVPYKYSENNGALTPTSGIVTWTVNHGLNTQDVVVQVRDLYTNSSVEVDVTYTSVDEVTLSWVSGSVIADAYRVTVIG